jgi:adenylylsulfate kinase-like enzyme
MPKASAGDSVAPALRNGRASNALLMIIVDFYGRPGSGKSTLAADLFNYLKLEGVNC